MTTHKLERHQSDIPYTMQSRDVVQKITNPYALAIWTFLMSLPDDWNVSEPHIRKHFQIGRTSYLKAMKYLREANLYKIQRFVNEKGEFTGSCFHIYGIPYIRESTYTENRTYITENDIITENNITTEKDIHTLPKSDFTLPQHIDKEIWDEWMQIRKRLRAINSPRAKKMLLSELDKCEAAGITANNAIDIAISKSWKSINPSWITNLDKSHDDKRSRSERGHDNLMQLCGSAYSDSDDGGQDIFDVLPDVAGSVEGKNGRGRAHSEGAEKALDSEDARFHNANRVEGNQFTNH